MIKLIQKRRTGKTTELIKISADMQIPIVCPNIGMAKMTMDMAEKMGLKIIEPLTVRQFKRGFAMGMLIKSILIDELDMTIRELLGVDIYAYTLSFPNIGGENMEIIKSDIPPMMPCEHKAPKPPLGLMPHQRWAQDRINEILEATRRYMQYGKSVPIEWITEYNKLIEDMSNAT